MSRIICWGDLHGSKIWKAIVNKEIGKATKFVAIGDYFDSYTLPFDTIWHNFLDICAFKEKNPELVVMLIGNHDAQYMKCCRGRDEFICSGFDELNRRTAYNIMDKKDHLLQIGYEQEGFLFTHAGITRTWAYDNLIDTSNVKKMCQSVTQRWKFSPLSFAYKASYGSGTGDHPAHSPLWVRWNCLRQDRIYNVKQIVGHTPRLQLIATKSADAPVFIDTLHVNQYLIIQDGELSVGDVYEH